MPQQLRLPRLALRAVFAEAGREHHERADTFELAFPRGLRDERRGDGDDGQVHRSGDVCDGCVGSPAGDGLRVRVDRIDRPAERAGHEIADDRPADAHPPARGADHRDRGRLEDVAHCGHGADPVALLEVVDRLLSQLGRQLDLEHARLGTHLDGEARVAEHLKHPAVGRDAPTPRRSRCHSPRRAERGAPTAGWRCPDPARRPRPRRRARRDRASRRRSMRGRRPSPQGRRPPPGRCRARRATAPRAPRPGPTRGSGTSSPPATGREGRRRRPRRLRGRSGAGGRWSRRAGRRRCRRWSRLTRWPAAVRRPWRA